MKYSNLTYYLLAILCIVATSCVADGVMDEHSDYSENQEMVKDAQVSLVLNFAINNAETRAEVSNGEETEGEIDERRIKDVHIYAFQENSFKEEVKYISIFGTDGESTRTIQGRLTESYRSDKPVIFIVIANGEEKKIITSEKPALNNQSTPESLYKQLVFNYNDNNDWSTYIPMAGSCTINPLQEGDYNIAKLELTRAVAKVNVTVKGGKGLNDFRITQIKLCNYNTEGYCATDTSPYIPSNVAQSKTPISSAIFEGKEGDKYENHIYIPEHKNIGADEGKQVYLEIDAILKETVRKYRLPFTHNGKTHDVLRNYMYVFNIQSVTMYDLHYEVKKWEEINIDVPSFD
ncbi:FimB/Mfa2 family fimbrial subunit [uncultured Bacteroides sp.]|uniref:FimB/Mfa2 family fimbrial subunit n=1 Tax=uncultured Bacteroides sp. TaxID=162156 RepID=UPI0025DB5804|nr:FimB/Mfa2 family fimbrial subunit [uncultured Bacteroides sp.]